MGDSSASVGGVTGFESIAGVRSRNFSTRRNYILTLTLEELLQNFDRCLLCVEYSPSSLEELGLTGRGGVGMSLSLILAISLLRRLARLNAALGATIDELRLTSAELSPSELETLHVFLGADSRFCSKGSVASPEISPDGGKKQNKKEKSA